MTDQDRLEALDLYRQLLVRFGWYKDRPGAAEAFADDLEGVPGSAAVDAAFDLYAADPETMPNGMMVRRRVARRFGVLAPNWGQAVKLRGQVRDGRLRLRDLPGPVLWHVPAEAVGADWDKPFAEAYEAASAEHDIAVLRPGGFARLARIGVEFADAWELEDLVQQARVCQGELGEAPSEVMTREDALAVKARYEARRLEPPGERWTPARVRAAAAGGSGPLDPTVAIR